MPLASINKVYKNFPAYFADKVTEHVRKRSNSYRQQHADLTDNEVMDVCSQKPPPAPGSRPATTQARPPSRAGGRSLTTKRSDTPLGVVSDAESDSDSPRVAFSSHSGSPSPQAPSPSCVQEPTGYLASTFNYLTNPRWPKTSPRMCTSLDNVDLWESDEESDLSQGYDKINGIAINPSKTIDLSDLNSAVRRSRSPVECKRNKTEGCSRAKSGGQRVPRVEVSRDQAVNPVVKTPRRASNGLLPDLPRSGAEPSKHESHRELNQLQTSVDGSIGATSKQNNSKNYVRRSSSNRQPSKPLKSIHDNNSNVVRRSLIGYKVPQEVTSSPSRIPATHVKASQLGSTYSGTTRTGATHTVIHSQAIHMGSPHVPTPPSTKKFSKPMSAYARERMRQNNQSPEPSLEIDAKDSPNTRKVKFQNFVTVREGLQSKTEDLRMSNNSAQQYKQKYLGSGSPRSPAKSPALPPYNPANYEDSEDSMDQSTWRMGMVC